MPGLDESEWWCSMNDLAKNILNQKSLRELVYEYLRDQMNRGGLVPGAAINLAALSQELGVSKTPLRDALIQLESEGFVTILPRRGIFVNHLTIDDIHNAYQIIGSLEATALKEVFGQLRKLHFSRMKSMNARMIQVIREGDFESYYRLNLSFHDVFLDLLRNQALRRILTLFKLRLYDFPRRGYIEEWELRNCEEHSQFIESLETGELDSAVHVLRDVHWCFAVQEAFIRKFYFPDEQSQKAVADG
jgi:DNA-binding GntR family transcriptional regulator